MSTANKINYLLQTKNQIKDAIEGKGVSIEDTDSFRSYATKIGQIESGEMTNPSTEDWQPEPDWFDIETILENDTEDYTQKVICLLTDELDDKATKNYVIGGEKYKLSDGQIIEKTSTSNVDISTLFDVTKDKACSKGYKTRYIIYYSNESNMNITLPNNVIYTIFSNVKFSSSPFQSKRYLQSFKLKNNTEIIGNSMSDFCYGCFSLKKVPIIDTSNKTNFYRMFGACYLLQKIPQLDTSNGTNFSNMFNNCYSLKEIPKLDTSNGTDFSSIFYNCYSLKEIVQLDISKGNTFATMFYNCYLLKRVSELNTNNSKNFSGMFSMTHSMVNLEGITYISQNPNLNSNFLNHSSLMKMLNALIDLTGQEAKNINIGTTNLNKLTDEEKAIAIQKNWTLS